MQNKKVPKQEKPVTQPTDIRPKPKVTCPECLSETTQEELNTFGGLCETCSEICGSGFNESED